MGFFANIVRKMVPTPALGGDELPKEVHEKVQEKLFIEAELLKWKQSPKRHAMIDGERYYRGDHDILARERTCIGRDGRPQVVHNLPNNRIVDNRYSKLVSQKANYIVGKPITLTCDDERYLEALSVVLDKKFDKLLKTVAEDALNCGVAWVMPYYDADGEFRLMRFEPYEILPFWKDSDHTELSMAARLYVVEQFDGIGYTLREKCELYYPDRIETYYFDDGILVPESTEDYVVFNDDDGNPVAYNWGCVPLVPFKYNAKEIPLIKKCKGIQDAINTMISDFENNMQEDARNTILVIKNYDGQNLAEFRHNLSTYGAIKVRSVEGVEGGVDTLQVSVNADNYTKILAELKKSMVENCMGFDAKDDRMSGNPNQMNILSMYADIDLDANGMETEFQASMEQLLGFVNIHLGSTGTAPVEVIFNRDMMMNIGEVIDQCVKSVGILSDETIVAMHPWVTDVKGELERKAQETSADELYGDLTGDTHGEDAGLLED